MHANLLPYTRPNQNRLGLQCYSCCYRPQSRYFVTAEVEVRIRAGTAKVALDVVVMALVSVGFAL